MGGQHWSDASPAKGISYSALESESFFFSVFSNALRQTIDKRMCYMKKGIESEKHCIQEKLVKPIQSSCVAPTCRPETLLGLRPKPMPQPLAEISWMWLWAVGLKFKIYQSIEVASRILIIDCLYMYISSHGKPQTVKKLRHSNFHLVLDIRGVPQRCTGEELVEYSWDIFEIQKADNNAISLIHLFLPFKAFCVYLAGLLPGFSSVLSVSPKTVRASTKLS